MATSTDHLKGHQEGLQPVRKGASAQADLPLTKLKTGTSQPWHSRISKVIPYTRSYTAQATRRSHPHVRPDCLHLIVAFPAWLASQTAPRKDSAFSRPWLSFSAYKHIRSRNWQNTRVFEYGCGYSTFFFLEQGAHVTTVEHEASRFRALEASIPADFLERWEGKLVEPTKLEAGEQPGVASESLQWEGHCFERYVRAIEASDDDSYDAVLIDGRCRQDCFSQARNKVKSMGWLILNNVECVHYQRLLDCEQHKWDITYRGGPTPGSEHFTITAFLEPRRPSRDWPFKGKR